MPRTKPLVIGVAVCILLRLAFLPLAYPVLDAERTNAWWRWSESLLRHGTLGFEGVASAYQEPLYPLFLAALRAVSGDSMLAILLVQIALCALGAVLLHRLALRLSGDETVAWIAALLFAAYPYLARQAVSLIPASVFTTVLIAATLATTRVVSHRSALVCGLLWGLANGLRLTALPPLLACVGVLLVLRRRPTHALLVGLGALLVLLPIGLRNQAVDGIWVPSRAGYNLIKGNNQYADQVLPRYSVDALEPVLIFMLREIRPGVTTLDVSEVDAEVGGFFYDKARAFAREHPWRTLELRLENLVSLFHWRIVPFAIADESRFDGRHLEITKVRERWWGTQAFYTVPYLMLMCAVVPGLWMRRRRLRSDWPLLAVALGFVATYTIFWPATKQRAPMDFVLLFYAACGLAPLWQRLRDSRSPAPPPEAELTTSAS